MVICRTVSNSTMQEAEVAYQIPCKNAEKPTFREVIGIFKFSSKALKSKGFALFHTVRFTHSAHTLPLTTHLMSSHNSITAITIHPTPLIVTRNITSHDILNHPLHYQHSSHARKFLTKTIYPRNHIKNTPTINSRNVFLKCLSAIVSWFSTVL